MTEKKPQRDYDVAVIGGGIHGVSMACEAASRGLRVILLQARDIAAGASSATSTLLSGDLRRVEQLSWGQVRRNLVEQQLLMDRAPHLVAPHRYTLVGDRSVRSPLRLRAMLWMYKRLQPRPLAQALHLKHALTVQNAAPEDAMPIDADGAAQEMLKEVQSPLLQYQDCSGLDYRLTVCTALQAQSWGATILPRHRVVGAQRQGSAWELEVEPQADAGASLPFSISATCVINSCGWLANTLLNHVLRCPSRCVAQPLNVGYLILRKTWSGNDGFTLQAADHRLVYLTPLLDNYWVLGPALAKEQQEKTGAVDDLIALYNRHFARPISRGDILHQRWSRHAVFEDPSSRGPFDQLGEAILDLNNPYGQAPLLNVFGINVLTHRLLAERGLNILQPFTGKAANPELKSQPLPGAMEGDCLAELSRVYPALGEQLLRRLARTYGSLSFEILEDRRTTAELGHHFGRQLYEVEVRYLQRNEWARTAEDILWRRTQLGIRFREDEVRDLADWLRDNSGALAGPSG